MSLFSFVWKKSKLTLCFLTALSIYAVYLMISGEGAWGVFLLIPSHLVLWLGMNSWKKDLEKAEERERQRILSLAKFAIEPKYRSSSMFLTPEALVSSWEFSQLKS